MVESQKNRQHTTSYRLALCMAVSICAAVYALPSHAGNMYVLKNQQGETLLTNVKHDHHFSGYDKVEKKTWYPESNMHTYRDWGKSEAAVLPSYSKNKNAFDGYIAKAAQQYQVDHGLLKAIMHTESGFNPNARSPVGAQGLMQLMPATARRFSVTNAFDPAQNIHAGAKYLSWLLKRFNNNVEFALAGYNAGEGNVDKYKGIPPFKETRDYVKRVMSRYHNLYAGTPLAHSSTHNMAQPVSTTLNSEIARSSKQATIYVTDNAYTASRIESH